MLGTLCPFKRRRCSTVMYRYAGYRKGHSRSVILALPAGSLTAMSCICSLALNGLETLFIWFIAIGLPLIVMQCQNTDLDVAAFIRRILLTCYLIGYSWASCHNSIPARGYLTHHNGDWISHRQKYLSRRQGNYDDAGLASPHKRWTNRS